MRYHRHVLVLATAVLGCLGLLLTGCDDQPQQKLRAQSALKNEIIADVVSLATSTDGASADALNQKIQRTSQEASVAIDAGKLGQLARNAWFETAKSRLYELRELRNNPERAKQLRAEFYDAQNKSGRALKEFGNTADGINRLVARNLSGASKLESSSAQPAKSVAPRGHRRRGRSMGRG